MNLKLLGVVSLLALLVSCNEIKTKANLVELNGKLLMEQKCFTCHNTQGTDNMLAPPMFRVKDHYIYDYEDKTSFVNAVVAWVENPQDSLSRMPGAKRKFGLMPKQNIPKDELKAIASYIYDWNTDNESCEH